MPKPKHAAVVPTEFAALGEVVKALEPLRDDARARVMLTAIVMLAPSALSEGELVRLIRQAKGV